MPPAPITIASDRDAPLQDMLEGYDCPAILVSLDYLILATNSHYVRAFGAIDRGRNHHCYAVSHGYQVPCDQAGEDCPLGSARESGHKERVLHIHQTPRGEEHVDVELLPIHAADGRLLYFVELLRPVPLASGAINDQELIGSSPPFLAMLAKVARVSRTDAAVLLLGESGTGKELVARAVHLASKRSDKTMVTLECAGLTDALFESELFGHVKGAFTGAQFAKKGLVEHADGGTLFLDELGDIPLDMQVKLLRLLETGTYRRVGSPEVRRTDFRLICATHKDLLHMVEQGTFRSDLYFRINVFPIRLPSLAERIEDIPKLAQSLLARIDKSRQYRLTRSALECLATHHYRGNIRELRNLLNRAIILADAETLDAAVIEEALSDQDSRSLPGRTAGAGASDVNKEQWVDLKTNEQNYLRRLLDAHDGNKERVAAILGISTRSLYRKIQA